MSAAGTVLATSAEGAGDMPSLDPTAGTDAGDGSPTFSQVLSLSSPDLPEPSGNATRAAAPAATNPPTDAAAKRGPEEPSPAPVGSSGRRGHRHADPSGSREQQSRGVAGSAAAQAGRAEQTGPAAPSTPTPTQAGTCDVGTEHSAATTLASTSFAVPAPVLAADVLANDVPSPDGTDTTVASTALVTGENAAAGTGSGAASDLSTTAAHDGPVASSGSPFDDEPSIQDPLDESASATRGLVTPDSGPDRDTVPSNSTATARALTAAVASTNGRVSVDRAAPLEPNALHVGPEPVGVSGPAAAAPVSAEGVSETAEFPDEGAGTVAATVDIDDLTASISRPLAAGSGEYSVQVSLHPPELGEVRALLSLQGDVLHVTLTPEHASGYDALSDAMPALHEQLAGRGVEVNVTLGQPGDTRGEDGWRPAHAGASNSGPSDEANPAVTPSAFPLNAGSPGRINLVL